MRSEIQIGLLVIILLVSSSLGYGSDKISACVRTWLEEAHPGDSLIVWVFFTDKGKIGAYQKQSMLEEIALAYDPKARQRRLRADPQAPFDDDDLPLFRPYIEDLKALGVRFRAFSKWLNAVSIIANRREIEAIAREDFVKKIRRVGGSKARLEPKGESASPKASLGYYGESYRQLEQIQVTDLQAEDYSGTGIRIAVFDTGFWLEHEALSGLNVIAEHDFINDDDETANEPGDDPYQHYHGTSVLSAVGGYSPGKLIGPAFAADYILAKTEDISIEQPIEEDWWIEACEWADSLGADIITSSLCYKDWYTYEDMDGDTAPITNAADRAVLKGIVVTNAAGNSGSSSWRYILAPADGDSVISVGSVDSTGIRSTWSSQGPTFDGRIKPTVMAMGQATFIANADSATSYIHGSGTSFATPLVAGAIALILEKNPLWLPPQVIEAAKMTATQAANPDTFYGWGILQAYDASQYDVSGISDARIPNLLIYPNPTQGEVYLWPCKQANTKICIYDVRGRLIATSSVDTHSPIDLDAIIPERAPSILFLKTSSGASAKITLLR